MSQTIVFDFDGVIHSYKSGWCGTDNIPDEPVEGIEDLLKQLKSAKYRIVIVSTRCRQASGIQAIQKWLEKYGLACYIDKISKEKPPALVYIDDRAICFKGTTAGLFEQIQNFKSWTKE